MDEAYYVQNQRLVLFFVFLTACQLFILPFLLPLNTALLALIFIPLIFLNTPFWGLFHEGIHSNLAKSTRKNDLLARITAICFGSPFRCVQTPHLLHHRYNRTPLERHEVYDPKTVSLWKARFRYYSRLLFGVYLQELFIPLAVLLPKRLILLILEKGIQKESYSSITVTAFLKRKNLEESRVDLVLILLLMSASFLCYGKNWPVLVFLLAARAFVVSFSDYLYHYATPVDASAFAFNLWLPRSFSRFILHFNYHGTHHLWPTAHWQSLPRVFLENKNEFHHSYFLKAIGQLRGPLTLDQLKRITPSVDTKETDAETEQKCIQKNKIRALIQKVKDRSDLGAPSDPSALPPGFQEALQDALQSRAIGLLSEEKQWCIAAELTNYMHSESDLDTALSYLKNKAAIGMFVIHSCRRQKVVDALLKSVQLHHAFSTDVKEAFGLQSEYHEEVLRKAVIDQRLTRKKAILCCYNGERMNQELGHQTISVPIQFQTKDDIYVRKETLPSSHSPVRFERIYPIAHQGAQFNLKVTNAIELWRATSFLDKEPETVQWIEQTVSTGSVFLDVGANIGVYSLLALAKRTDIRAICIEPDSLNFSRLVENLHLNHFGDRAVAYPIGLSDENKFALFHSSCFIAGKAENWVSGSNSRENKETHGAVTTGCSVFTLDRFLSDQPDLSFPTHLKIDVDGPEVRILKGAAKTLTDPRLKHLLIELFEDEKEEVIPFLASFGFKQVGGRNHTKIAGPRGHMGNCVFRK